MRHLLVIPMLAAVTLASLAHGEDRDAILKQFTALEAETMAAMSADNYESVEATLNNQKFRLIGRCGPQVQVTPGCLAVKIWGQLINPDGSPGPYVNLTKHKWQRLEKFYLWLQTAVPVQLSFFQNYPEGRPASRQVSPDPAFPSTFATIMPGAPYRFPVMIEMDDDLRDEQMGIVLVRADSQILPINGAAVTAGASASATATANATTIINGATLPPGSRVTVSNFAQSAASVNQATQAASAGATAGSLGGVVGPGGTLKSAVADQTKEVFASIYNAGETAPAVKGRMKLRLVAGPPPTALPTMPPVPASINDVSTVMIGPGNIAQIELTLFKD